MNILSGYDMQSPSVYIKNGRHSIKASTVDSLGVEDIWWEIFFDTISIIERKKMLRLIKRKNTSISIWRRLYNSINIQNDN